MQVVKMATYNVNGLVNPIKRSKILTKLKRDKVEVAFLQETHLSDTEHAKLRRLGFKHQYSSSYAAGHRRGVVILISNNISFEPTFEKKDTEGRYILVRGNLDGSLVSLLNVYAPPNSDWTFFKQIFDLIIAETQGVLICGGDLNIRLNPILDSSNVHIRQPKLINKKFKLAMEDIGLVDVWREINPSKRDYTFFSNPHLVYSRIDYFLTFGKDLHRVGGCDMGIMDLSDHCPIYLKFNLEQDQRNTLWRLNTYLLNNMRDQMKKDITEYLEQNDNGEVSPPILWDACKAVLRGQIIGYSARFKRAKQKELDELQGELKQLEQNHKDSNDQTIRGLLQKKRNEINEIYTKDIQKKLIFTKQKYYEGGGKASKLLAYRLKKQQAENSINKIRNPITNSIQYKLKEIQNCFEGYYRKLYSQPQIDGEKMEAFFKGVHLPKLTSEQGSQMVVEITEKEISLAIAHLKSNKAPGPDGFPSEWYKVMEGSLVSMLQSTFNWVLKENIIPPSWKEAVISLIPKEGKDKTECSNFRPISVLNQDYKIFTHILAKRIEGLLPQIISLDQTGFVQERQTHDSIRRSLHIINHITESNLEAVLVGLDAEKAFDCVNWTFLFRILDTFGFHSSFIKTIQALYDRPRARIKINGAVSNSFPLERGTRQGCPISPLLFAIFIEPLSQWIIQNNSIKGIVMNGVEQKISLFADDILVYLSSPEQSLVQLFSTLEQYGSFSGYKLNVLKTQILSFKYCPSVNMKKNYTFGWDAESIKYLGVNIPIDLTKLFLLNYLPLNQKIREDIRRWDLVPFLSLISRIESVKMVILPRLLYLFQSLPLELSDQQFQEWDKLISRYIWQGRKPRFKYQSLQLAKNKGGVALPCLKDYYIAAQLRPLICWCNPKYVARWKEMESAISEEFPIQAAIGDKVLMNKLIKLKNPWICLSLKVWNRLVTQKHLREAVKVLRWCVYDPEFLPGRWDARFKCWSSKGLTAYCTFLHKGSMNSFQNLKGQFDLKSDDFYRFLQVRHYIDKIQRESIQVHWDNTLLKVFKDAYLEGSNKKAVSKIYRSLQETKGNSLYVKQKWEREGNLVLEEEDWENLCEMQWKTSSSTSWREFCWKNLIRFFITPAQKRHYTNSSACWRQCGCIMANHFHIFWSCTSLNPFWQQVHGVLEKVFRVDISFKFETLYLGVLPLEMFSSKDRYLFRILSAACKKAITRMWLKPGKPTLDEWIDIVYDIFKMERITLALRLQQGIFLSRWEKWIIYVTPIRPSFV